jgi:hypothetical protein
MTFLRSYFLLSVAIFYFLKKKIKGFPLQSGLGQLVARVLFLKFCLFSIQNLTNPDTGIV